MQEAIIHLPRNDNKGRSLFEVHNWLRKRLAQTFGGYTSFLCEGGWCDQTDKNKLYAEDVQRYVIAASPEFAERNEKLKALAHEAGQLAMQVAIYWRDFDGNVSIDYLAPDECA